MKLKLIRARLLVAVGLSTSLGFLNGEGAIADIPPPSRFQTTQQGASKSKTAEIMALNDAVEAGQESHPPSPVYDVVDYCSVVVDVIAGPGVNVFLNVEGSSQGLENPQDYWFPENAPIRIRNDTKQVVTESYLVPLKHNVARFFLGLPSSPTVPDLNVAIGGSLTIEGTAIPCAANLK